MIGLLQSRPETFEFFRAVQVLEAELNRRRRAAPRRVGYDHQPSEVGLDFDVLPSLAFASQQVTSLRAEGEGADRAFDLEVSFVGLIGPAATLPAHYTETVLDRLQHRDRAFADYLRVFQSRSISMFYRAWKKYRLEVSTRDSDLERGEADPVLTTLMALIGRLPLPRHTPIDPAKVLEVHHAGHFSNRRRSSEGLRAMLAGLLGCRVHVEEFVGQWIALDDQARATLGEPAELGTPARLGDDVVLGSRVWSVDSRIRVLAGPLDRERFRMLWPGGPAARQVWSAIRSYIGPLIDCDLDWLLAEDAPTPVRLGGDMRLGRDCWAGWQTSTRPETRVRAPFWHEPHPEGVRPTG